jgi:FimV-like protein
MVPQVLPWLLMLGGVAGGVILWRRRRAGFQPDAAPQDFTNTLSATRTGGPRVFDISNAAAEMARSVETSQVATQLVRSDAAADDDVDVSRLAEHAAIKLEIARASLELGRTDDARALLQAVMREGSGRHAAEAAEILARMG